MNIDEIINRDDLRDRLDNDFELFKELSDIFMSDSQTHLDNIKSAIENKDAERLGKSAHTLKGSVSNFSALGAYEAALTLEKIGKNNEMDKAMKAYEVLEREIETLKTAMKELYKDEKF